MKKLLNTIVLLGLSLGSLFGQGRINFASGVIVLGSDIILNNCNSNAIITGKGYIIPQSELSLFKWNIGTAVGTYTVPFGDANFNYLPLTLRIDTAGIGEGCIGFSTYQGNNWNNSQYMPYDVTNMKYLDVDNNSSNAVDRFWILDAQGYSVKPAVKITFTYIRNGVASDIAAPNTISEASLTAQRFNSSLNTWDDWSGVKGSDNVADISGTVNSGYVFPADFFRSWCLFNSFSQLSESPNVNSIPVSIILFPNPTSGPFQIKGLIQGQVMQLFDLSGNLLMRKVIENNSILQFDISSFANGIYLIRILDKDGNLVGMKKVVKAE